MQFRDFTPDDYAAMVDIRNAIYPDLPITVEDFIESDAKRDPKCLTRRWMAEHEGRVIAYAVYDQSPWAYNPHNFFVTVRVHVDFQGQGYGSALYDAMMTALEPLDWHQLEMSAREDHTYAMRWIKERGFKLHIKAQRSVLELAEFDPTPWDGLTNKLKAEGIELLALPELQASDPDWARKHYELDMTVSRDIPGFDDFTPPSFEQWKKDVLDSPNISPETFIVAVHGGQQVALTQLWKSKATDTLFTGLTATRREYRRKGIATALKVKALKWAKENGCPNIQTDNEENNPMLQINYDLGFKDAPAWMIYRKTQASE